MKFKNAFIFCRAPPGSTGSLSYSTASSPDLFGIMQQVAILSLYREQERNFIAKLAGILSRGDNNRTVKKENNLCSRVLLLIFLVCYSF